MLEINILPDLGFEQLISTIMETIDYDNFKELGGNYLTEFPELEEKLNLWFDEFNQSPKDTKALHLVRLICFHYEKFPDIIEDTIKEINKKLGIKPFKKDVL